MFRNVCFAFALGLLMWLGFAYTLARVVILPGTFCDREEMDKHTQKVFKQWFRTFRQIKEITLFSRLMVRLTAAINVLLGRKQSGWAWYYCGLFFFIFPVALVEVYLNVLDGKMYRSSLRCHDNEGICFFSKNMLFYEGFETQFMTFDTIFFIGPQGSGKGTQARLLADRLGFFYWEMGAIFREISKSDTEIGKKVANLINQGLLVTDDIVLEMVKHKLAEIPTGQGIIFDGVPRTLNQGEFILDALREMHYTKFATLFIDLPRRESLSRLRKRAEIEHRVDDTEAKINLRLDQYEKDTIPVLDMMRKESEFITIDGKPPIEEVTSAINQALGLG